MIYCIKPVPTFLQHALAGRRAQEIDQRAFARLQPGHGLGHFARRLSTPLDRGDHGGVDVEGRLHGFATRGNILASRWLISTSSGAKGRRNNITNAVAKS
jgi:hypothetical protein